MASILVIEDVPAVLLSLRLVLQGAGHSVATATNGIEGLSMIQADAFDLVMTDIWMPGRSGAEVIRLGRDVAPRTRFLAITGGNPNAGTEVNGMASGDVGADLLLTKPFEKAELLQAVTLLLGRPAEVG